MRERIVDLLEKIDLAVASTVGVLPSASVEPVSVLRNSIQTRMSYPESVMVAGLVGGTGSGKSSLLNAVAGEEVSTVGGLRPTTADPVALVPEVHRGDLSGYLDRIGIEHRAFTDENPWLCLIDLPDSDSVVIENRLRLESILPLLDMVVWVMDPEKYRDSVTHEQISGLAAYREQFIFVINQADRVAVEHHGDLHADLTKALEEDGIVGPKVILVSADPPSGPPISIDSMVGALEEKVTDGSPVYRKLLSDLERASSALIAETSGASGLDFEHRWSSAIAAAREPIDQGRTSEVAHLLTSLLDELAREAGQETAVTLASLVSRVPDIVARAMEPSAAELPAEPVRWWRRRASPVEPPPSDRGVIDAIETEIGQPARQTLEMRAVCHAAIVDLHLGVAEAMRVGS